MGMPTNGGPCAVGIESSIVDCTRGQPVLDKDDVQAIGNTPRASGTLESHYAPNAKVRLMEASAMQTALDLLGADAAHIAVYARTILRIQSPNVLYRRMPNDPLATAQQLFSVVRSLDAQDARLSGGKLCPLTPNGTACAIGWGGLRRVEGLWGVVGGFGPVADIRPNHLNDRFRPIAVARNGEVADSCAAIAADRGRGTSSSYGVCSLEKLHASALSQVCRVTSPIPKYEIIDPGSI